MTHTRHLPHPRLVFTLLAAVTIGLAAHPAEAQERSRLQDHPGYADFDAIPRTVGLEPNVEVYIKGALLRLASEASRSQDPELGDMLDKMRAIRVFGYEPDRDWSIDEERTFVDMSNAIADDLESSGWDLVVRVREDGERVYVYLRDIDEVIQGMTVMVIEEDEAVFVNIVGEIDPAQVGRIGRRFDIDALEDVDIER